MPVYFIRVGETGPVKIGVSNNPQARLKAFDTHSPVPLRLIRVVDGNRHTERQLHERYRSLWLRGEWFLYCPTMEGDLGLSDPPLPLVPRKRAPDFNERSKDFNKRCVDFAAYLENGSDVLAKELAVWMYRV